MTTSVPAPDSTTDTIAAIATALGEAGVSVIRISGPQAYEIADRVFKCSGNPPSKRAAGTFAFGHVIEGQTIIDQALCLIMRSPHSYTGEDVVELQGHGGHQCAKRILRTCLEAGARLAQPGEFTQRAFLNGRMDLVQAEAVLDLIHARSARAAAAAMDQLDGQLSTQLNTLYDRLIAIAADIEATLDFPEDELPETVMPTLIAGLEACLGESKALLSTWDEGHLLRDGAVVVISGKPNVGKSTLLNGLLGRDRAIVSDTPGTTRDTIEEDLVIDGIPIRLIDTAGLRITDCEIEQIGIARTRDQMTRADLHIHLIDASAPADTQEIDRLLTANPAKLLIIANKIDLIDPSEAPPAEIYISATQLTDIENVKESIGKHLADQTDLHSRPHATISERHRNLLSKAQTEIQMVLEMLSTLSDDLVPLASSRMRDVLDYLGQVTGRTYHDELLNTIFSRFCIGK